MTKDWKKEKRREKIEETRIFSSTLPKFSLSASGVELTDSKKTVATLQVENAMLQLKQSRLQAEMNEMMLFYEEDKQVTDDEILGLKNVVCRNY